MSIEVKIPSVGESIVSGILSIWHKREGEPVALGDPLFTLETDKVSTEITAEKAGVMHPLVAQGEEVKIGQVVATIEEPCGEKGMPSQEFTSTQEPEKQAEPVPLPALFSSPRPAIPKKNVQDVTSDISAGISPIAPVATTQRFTRQKLSPLRRKIAAQLVLAQQTAAILTTFNECDMSAVITLRAHYQDAFTREHGVKLGFMSFFLKATVAALQAVPALNSRLDGDELILNHYYDLGVAVGSERGLVVPVIRDADQKSFAQLERDLLEHIRNAREGRLRLDDLQGGVFTLSNGGVYGSLLSTPILNPPQSGILGLHKVQERPVALQGEVVIRPMMNLALSYDHRVVDGKEAVTFLVKIKEAIEDPARLLLGVGAG